MKLHKALKLRKSLVGEITALKEQIKEKNSYLEGSKNGEKFDVAKAYDELLAKIDELTGLKFVINEANKEIQAQIYTLSEYKALIAFWKEVSVAEGTKVVSAYSEKVQSFVVQVDEAKRNEIVKTFQKRVDAIQEEIDTFNYTTEIPWDEPEK
jgi:2-oxo-4-hydroxy-4-carboxy--5-ureidoimidazoline (OHCU) decarboxylase